MAYIGKSIESGTFALLDTSGNTYNGSNTTFSLGTQVGSPAQLLVSHDGVIQKAGTDYTLASGGTQITFSTAPASGASIFITEISGAVGGTVTPSDTSVTADKLNTALLTGHTDIGANLADADLFLVDDGAGGTLRKVAASRIKTYAATTSATDSFSITGSTPTLTIGDAGAEDTKIVFDGNAQDYHIGLDDSADDLVIGKGSTLGTTTHMAFDENGHITKPLQSAFHAYNGSSQTNLAGDSAHTINIDTEVFDQNGDFNTSNYTFTAPVTGRYLFTYHLTLNTVDEGSPFTYAHLDTSNREYYHWFDNNIQLSADATYVSFPITVIADMDANDTALMKVFIGGGSAVTDTATSTNTWFTGCLLA